MCAFFTLTVSSRNLAHLWRFSPPIPVPVPVSLEIFPPYTGPGTDRYRYHRLPGIAFVCLKKSAPLRIHDTQRVTAHHRARHSRINRERPNTHSHLRPSSQYFFRTRPCSSVRLISGVWAGKYVSRASFSKSRFRPPFARRPTPEARSPRADRGRSRSTRDPRCASMDAIPRRAPLSRASGASWSPEARRQGKDGVYGAPTF